MRRSRRGVAWATLLAAACERPAALDPPVAAAAPAFGDPRRPFGEPSEDGPPWPLEPPPHDGERFTWMTAALPDWSHCNAASDRYRMQEILSGGVVLFDADGDGDLDLFCNTGGRWPDTPTRSLGATEQPQHALFRNDGAFRFAEIAAAAGVQLSAGAFAVGATAGDYDGDGDEDLYVTGDRRSWLYRNEGARDGVPRFVECAAELGLAAEGLLATSAAFLDADRDGRLDLYVAGYVAYDDARNERLRCGEATSGVRDYCSPKEFEGTQDRFFRQEADGRFRECAREVGLLVPEPLAKNGKGLGVVAADVDDDGDCDLFVANDGCPNLLFLNDGRGRFAEEGLVRGCALSSEGRSRAGMGTEAADYDGDGDLDLFVTNLDLESNGLFRNDGSAFFEDDAGPCGLAAQDGGTVGFGTLFLDADHDGDLDLAVANGHVVRHAWRTRGTLTLHQHDQLFENRDGGRFELLPPERAGAFFAVRNVARGAAAGDLDGDGDLDLVFARSGDRPVVLRNNHAERAGRADALLLDLVGAPAVRAAIGTRAWLTADGRTQVAEVKGGASYASRSDRRLHFALPAGGRATLRLRWPDGTAQEAGELAAGHCWRVVQGRAPEVVATLR
ncbi:MAG: VCBS repeat-containing protein [Planctomycetes bacterium]|nr:VCBS repeat-containing protein [Planctomycetota bacterium]